MKNKIILTTISAIIVLIGIVFLVQRDSNSIIDPVGFTATGGNFALNRVCNLSGSDATTTPVFLTTSGGEVSMVCDTAGARSLDINMSLIASSTNTVLVHKIEMADGRETRTNCVENPSRCNWFGETVSDIISTTEIQMSSTTVARTLKPDTTAFQRINTRIDPSSARFVRIKFSVTGANASLWAQGITLNEF